MSVSIAEYLGQRTDSDIDIIPVKTRKGAKIACPFRDGICDKIYSGNKPVCSVRNYNDGCLWLSCKHRLCSSHPKEGNLIDCQRNILHAVASKIYDRDIDVDDVLVKREVRVPVTEDSSYSADYVMWRKNPKHSPFNPDRAVILEMQGGGETTNTGVITEHINYWESCSDRNNSILSLPISKASPLVTNAWRRQQEQFLVKGNAAMLTGGRMVFCVGTMLYDYLMKRFKAGILTDLADSNWTLALLAFEEDFDAKASNREPIQLKIDKNRMIYTNYSEFIQALTNQGHPSSCIFTGEYRTLGGEPVTI